MAANVEQRRFLTLCDRRDYLKVVGGVSVGNPRVCGELGWMERTRKRTGKKGPEGSRAGGVLEGNPASHGNEGKDVCDFVLVDECGTHTSLWLPSTGIGLGQSEFTRR